MSETNKSVAVFDTECTHDYWMCYFKDIDTGSDDDTGPSGHHPGQPSSGSGPADNQFDGEDPDNEDADSAQYRDVPGVSVSGNATPEIAISGTFRCPNCNHQFAPGRDADR